jgi:hypothetical protein
MRFFGSKEATGARRGEPARLHRSSSGWTQLQKTLRAGEGLRVLDIGPTSAGNINYITGLGHSIYMANLVEEAARPEWTIAATSTDPARFDVERFIASNLNFSGRIFDIVLFWDTADYLPEPLLRPILHRLEEVIAPQGQILAFFHTKKENVDPGFFRYHLTDDVTVDMQRVGEYPIENVYNNRQIENLLSGFSSYRFFLAKDNLREVIATR